VKVGEIKKTQKGMEEGLVSARVAVKKEKERPRGRGENKLSEKRGAKKKMTIY